MTSTAQIPPDFEARLDAASKQLGVPTEQLVSIKVRPITKVGQIQTQYLWPDDYPKQIDSALDESQIKVLEGDLNSFHSPILGEFPSGLKFVYLRHESGPEFIFDLQVLLHWIEAIGATALAANQVITLINKTIELVSAAPSRGQTGNGDGPISVESRTKTIAKVLKQISETAKDIGHAIKSITQLVG